MKNLFIALLMVLSVTANALDYGWNPNGDFTANSVTGLSGPVAGANYDESRLISTPSNPASGLVRYYFKNVLGTPQLFMLNSSGLETQISGAGGGTVMAVTASSPLFSSGGTSPNITCQTASGSLSGCLSSGDWNTFNNKQDALTFIDSLTNTGGNVSLVNDSPSPGNSMYYGTDSGGTKGFFTFPASGITQLTGDVTAGPGSGSQAATLATVNGNVGSFTNANITVNAKGLITAAANGSGSTPAGANTDVQFNDSGAFGGTGDLTFDKTTGIVTGGALGMTLIGSTATGLQLAFGLPGNLTLQANNSATPAYIQSYDGSGFEFGVEAPFELGFAAQAYATAYGTTRWTSSGGIGMNYNVNDPQLTGSSDGALAINGYGLGGNVILGGSHNYTFTGDTHNGTAVIDNIVFGSGDTSQLLVNGVIWDPTHYPAGTRIVSIDSASQITVSNPSNADATAATEHASGYLKSGESLANIFANSYEDFGGAPAPISPTDGSGAFLQFQANEDWSNTTNGSRINMGWTKTGSGGPTQQFMALTISSENMKINGFTTPGYSFVSNPYIFVGDCAGTKTLSNIHTNVFGSPLDEGTARMYVGMPITSSCVDSSIDPVAHVTSIVDANTVTTAETLLTGTAQQVDAIGTLSLGQSPPGTGGWGLQQVDAGSLVLVGDVGIAWQYQNYNPGNYGGDNNGDALWFTPDNSFHYQNTNNNPSAVLGGPAPSGSRYDVESYLYYYMTTTDATAHSLATIPLADNTVYLVTAKCSARDTTSAGRIAQIFSGVFYREAAGIVTRQGTLDTSTVNESSFAPTVVANFAPDGGNNLLIQVTGSGTDSLNWECGYNARTIQ